MNQFGELFSGGLSALSVRRPEHFGNPGLFGPVLLILRLLCPGGESRPGRLGGRLEGIPGGLVLEGRGPPPRFSDSTLGLSGPGLEIGQGRFPGLPVGLPPLNDQGREESKSDDGNNYEAHDFLLRKSFTQGKRATFRPFFRKTLSEKLL
nr:MAG TPA: hypothetical protein [Caudoviricetes sp.]